MPTFTPKWKTADGLEWESEEEATAHEVLLITKKQIQLYLSGFDFRPNKRTEYESVITKWEEFKYNLENDVSKERDSVQSVVQSDSE
jgi:hypothetical protein